MREAPAEPQSILGVALGAPGGLADTGPECTFAEPACGEVGSRLEELFPNPVRGVPGVRLAPAARWGPGPGAPEPGVTLGSSRAVAEALTQHLRRVCEGGDGAGVASTQAWILRPLAPDPMLLQLPVPQCLYPKGGHGRARASADLGLCRVG